ncbi:Pc22g15350 [Penicillium rubens Wisconsin 54-1255]|uniref:Pc22g15350 protein n=1 Tax=Penicillium rubens (strain ATCC 28089 / DSM 1075 / NRRL 1951 / Wisconsin 54-1255) TaxID=500485 RepID=B6HVZ3_PENRW|nr:Pc22g15350 [Penicillium rubens Wisconsin 54-1255]
MTTPESRVIIVGGGVFGLSTALWLARGGYTDVTIFDRCNFDTNYYNPADGCDGASADINKIFRATYGSQEHSQDLALEARDIWLEWNRAIKESHPSDLPRPLTPEDELLTLCGVYHLADGPTMIPRYVENLRVMEDTAPSFRNLQFIKNNTDDEKRAGAHGPEWAKKFHLFDKFKDGVTNGFLDAGSGITLADKACVYARYLCQKAGVKFVLGRPHGELDHLITEGNGSDKRIKGIRTCDGLAHAADLVVVACGPWTAAVLPEAHRSVEATMGTVMFIDVPEDRKDLRDKFHPDNIPVWRFIQGEGEGPEPINTVPLYGLGLMKQVIGGLFPELAEIGFTDSRLCWYTDSIDNEFLIDYVPGYSDSLFICTGGSGHGFKFLPVLGKYVKNQLERVPDRFTPIWKWRTVEEGKQCNGLEEGEAGPREMSKLKLANQTSSFLLILEDN